MAFSPMSWGSLLLTTATWFIRVGFVRRIIAGRVRRVPIGRVRQVGAAGLDFRRPEFKTSSPMLGLLGPVEIRASRGRVAGPLGFPSEHLSSQLDHFGFERVNQLLFLLDLGFPLDCASMLGLPIVSLLTQFDLFQTVDAIRGNSHPTIVGNDGLCAQSRTRPASPGGQNW